MTNKEIRLNYFRKLFNVEGEFRFEYLIEKNPLEILRFSDIDNDILHDGFVYLTNGISDFLQPGPTTDPRFKNIEFSAYSDFIIQDKTIENSDLIADIIFEISSFPFKNLTSFEHGQTFDFGRPFIPNSELEGIYFSSPPFIKYPDLFNNTKSIKSILHLVPISRKEMEFKLQYGIEKFLDLMQENSIEQFMDLRRKSCI